MRFTKLSLLLFITCLSLSACLDNTAVDVLTDEMDTANSDSIMSQIEHPVVIPEAGDPKALAVAEWQQFNNSIMSQLHELRRPNSMQLNHAQRKNSALDLWRIWLENRKTMPDTATTNFSALKYPAVYISDLWYEKSPADENCDEDYYLAPLGFYINFKGNIIDDQDPNGCSLGKVSFFPEVTIGYHELANGLKFESAQPQEMEIFVGD